MLAISSSVSSDGPFMKAKKGDITHKLKIARGQLDGILQMVEEDRYCVLVKWSDFCSDPETHIDRAFNKSNHPISGKIKVRP